MSDRDEFNDYVAGWWMECHMNGRRLPPTWWLRAMFVWDSAKQAFLEWRCKKFGGCDWVDAGSYATPDTGKDCLTCRRCGQYWEHIYY